MLLQLCPTTVSAVLVFTEERWGKKTNLSCSKKFDLNVVAVFNALKASTLLHLPVQVLCKLCNTFLDIDLVPVKRLVVVLYLVGYTEISVRTDVISYNIVRKPGVTGFKQNYPLVWLTLQNGFVCFIWGIITLNLDLADRSQRAMSQGLK